MRAPSMFWSELPTSEGNGRGNTGGEQGHRVRCSPSLSPGSTRVTADERALAMPSLHPNFNQRRELPDERIGRRLVPPDKCDPAGEVVDRSTVA